MCSLTKFFHSYFFSFVFLFIFIAPTGLLIFLPLDLV